MRYHTSGNTQSWRTRGYQDRMRVPGPIIGFEQVKTAANRFVTVATVLGLLLVAVMAFEAVRAVHEQRLLCSEYCK